MPGPGQAAAAWRPAYRRLLRAALAHDRRPHLKALLPVWGEQAVPHSSPTAVPLAAVARAAFAASPPRPGGVEQARENAAVLEFNLRRREIHRSQGAREAERLAEDAGAPAHPNLAWFYGRLEELVHNPGSGKGRGDALDCLVEMIEVGCPPPRRLYVDVISSLGMRPSSFERALEAFWLMERASPYIPCSDVAAALVGGAQQVGGIGEARNGAVWRAFGIWRTLVETAGLLPQHAASNTVASAAAGLVRAPVQLQGVLSALEGAAAAGMEVADSTLCALLGAHDRLGEMELAYDLFLKIKALVHLHEWAVANGDDTKASFLEAELVRTGKASYLGGASNPQC